MNKTISIMAAMLPLLFTSCNNDDANVTTYPQEEHAVTLGAAITRTGDDTQPFADGDTIRITNVTRRDLGLHNNYAMFTYSTANNGSWTAVSKLLWCEGAANTFQAVYPRTAGYSSFTVPADQSTEQKLRSADWMTGENTVTLSNSADDSPVDITLTRKMAMVVVNATHRQSWGATPSAIFVLPQNVQAQNLNSETLALVTANADGSNTFTAIIPTGSIASGNTFCTINDGSVDIVRNIPDNFPGFEAGKKYTFTLVIDNSGGQPAPTRSASTNCLTLVSVEPM